MGKGSGSTRGGGVKNSHTGDVRLDSETSQYLALLQNGASLRDHQNEYYAQERREEKLTEVETKLLNANEQQVISDWIDGESWDLNRALRNGDKLTAEQRNMVKTFDTILSRPSAKLPKDMIVYRADSEEYSGTLKGYTSVSQSLNYTTAWGSEHIHAYKLPKGTKGITVGEGFEIILPRGFNLSKYRIK